MLSYGILKHTTLISGYVNRYDNYDITVILKSDEGLITGYDVQISGKGGDFFSSIILNFVTFLGDTTFAIQSAIVILADSAAGGISEVFLGGNFVEIVSSGSLGYSENGGTIEDTLVGTTVISLLLRIIMGERN